MYVRKFFRFKIIGSCVLLSTIMASSASAVGSGGILNLVPQARVWLEQNGTKQQLLDWKVYVHPLEGSLVLISQDKCIALDKNKNHAIQMDVNKIKVLDSGNMIDVPEKIPYTVLRHPPHFNRTYANVLLDDGSLLTVDVER